MKLDQLVSGIVELQGFTQSQATKQVNQWLTLRNWLIGCYIAEYELSGEGRAAYGEKVIPAVAKYLKQKGLKGFGTSNLASFIQFFHTYPQIFQTLSGKLDGLSTQSDIFQSLSGKLNLPPKRSAAPTADPSIPAIPIDRLINSTSWSHFVEFIRIDDPIKRAFYELQTMNQAWSVRQLKRALESSLYERTGLSTDKSGVIASFDPGKSLTAAEIVRDPYFLEFLNLPERSSYSESDLEQAIIDNLQEFLIEMGEGFCFEARQRRITFGNTHYQIDLVFYHRILKCHVLIDLKIGKFDHGDSGQMNVYLNYFKDHMHTEGDNPPIGIILCADKDDSLVKYATGGMDQQLFVSQYLIKLPTEEALKALIQRQTNL